MKVCKIIALAAALGFALTFSTSAYAGGECRNQPNMQAALDQLRSARASLEHAEHDKGGWRAKAIEATDKAINETKRGCEFADKH